MISDGRKILFVSGLSGAGKSTALKALEDAGVLTIDNIPIDLIPPLLTRAGEWPGSAESDAPIAIGIDSRTPGFTPTAVVKLMEELAADGKTHPELLFLSCSAEALTRRYEETRRRHPLARDRQVIDGISEEIALLAPLQDVADFVIDTTDTIGHELRRAVVATCGLTQDARPVTTIVSFSYARGLPRNADLVLDVRFLRNPHYDEALRPLTGKDQAVADFVKSDPFYEEFSKQTRSFFKAVAEAYREEGKGYLTLAIGCTGGRHRSVTVAEHFGELLGDILLGDVTVRHRELESGMPPVGQG